MAKEWYVLRVASGREETVKEGLLKKIQLAGLQTLVPTVLVPTERVSEIKGGKKRFKERKLYPGYIIVEMDLTDDVWYLIKDTSGIGDFVGSFQKPSPLPASDVEKILNTLKSKDETPEVKIDLDPGDRVKIKEGPFENFDGSVDEVFKGKGQVRVIVTIFGRATPVDLEYWQVEKI
ncbi:MAG TPA: transcription termination/antitermination protein NusG [Planctomycetota bacterium]|jgi:transcriptional antiterminator NusG|nr:transcription termination/antitermination protein NusG [Planctomycetota bacterium]